MLMNMDGCEFWCLECKKPAPKYRKNHTIWTLKRHRKELLKPLQAEVQKKPQLLEKWMQLSLQFSTEGSSWLQSAKRMDGKLKKTEKGLNLAPVQDEEGPLR